MEYWLVAMGACIGFGCIWRFPYMMYKNGGAVFLIPYYLVVFFFGIPLMMMETAYGQYFRTSLMEIFQQVSRKYVGIPVTAIMTSLCVSTYYIYLMAYCVIYMFTAFGTLPWMEEGESKVLENARKFYEESVLKLNPVKDQLGGINFQLWVAVTISWVIVYICIRKGVEQTGKIAFVTVLLPYLLLTIFLIRTAMLDGFGVGVRYMLYPDISKLFTVSIWKDAMVQVAFQLGFGQGIIGTLAGFRKPSQPMVLANKWICLINTFTGMLASFVIFGYLGYFSKKYDIPMEELQVQGPGLVFITIPACISTMMYPNLWVMIFFFTLILIGIDTQFGFVEAITYFIEDLKLTWKGQEIREEYLKLATCIGIYILGLPVATRGGQYVLSVLDIFGFAIPASMGVLLSAYVWVKRTQLHLLIGQMTTCTKEEFPTFFVWCLDKLSIPLGSIMLLICVFITAKDGFFAGEFTPQFMVFGMILLCLIVSPTFYYYLKHRDAPEESNPYVIDLTEGGDYLTTPIAGREVNQADGMRELQRHYNDNNGSSSHY